MNPCHNNPIKSSTTKIHKHTAFGYSLFTPCSFDAAKNKIDHYRDDLYNDLKEHATEITNFEKKEMIPLTNEENESYLKHHKHILYQEFIFDIDSYREGVYIKS